MTIQWKQYKRWQNKVLFKKERSQNYSTAASARRGTTKAWHRARCSLGHGSSPFCLSGHLMLQTSANKCKHCIYLQTSLPLVPQPHFPLGKFSATPGSANFHTVSCHTEQSLISVTRTRRCGLGLKLTFSTLKIGSYRPFFTSAVGTLMPQKLSAWVSNAI